MRTQNDYGTTYCMETRCRRPATQRTRSDVGWPGPPLGVTLWLCRFHNDVLWPVNQIVDEITRYQNPSKAGQE